MVVQQLLSVIQAVSDLAFGQRTFPNAADSVGEGGISVRSSVRITKTVWRLNVMVRVSASDGMNDGSPSQFPGGNILAAVKKFRGQRRQVVGCVEVGQRIQTDGSLRCAVSISSTSHWTAGKKMTYSSGSQ